MEARPLDSFLLHVWLPVVILCLDWKHFSLGLGFQNCEAWTRKRFIKKWEVCKECLLHTRYHVGQIFNTFLILQKKPVLCTWCMQPFGVVFTIIGGDYARESQALPNKKQGFGMVWGSRFTLLDPSHRCGGKRVSSLLGGNSWHLVQVCLWCLQLLTSSGM